MGRGIAVVRSLIAHPRPRLMGGAVGVGRHNRASGERVAVYFLHKRVHDMYFLD